MTIFGVALLATCTIIGSLMGEALGHALGVRANVGGVGLAMLLLIGARVALARRGWLDAGVVSGVGFWGALYIPIVVAMAASQDVVAAAGGGMIAVIGAGGTVALCYAAVALLGRFGERDERMDEIEARERAQSAEGTPRR